MSTAMRGLTIVLFLAAASRFATAGGPVQSLPPDGCWVKFFLAHEVSDPDGVTEEHTGSWTVSSVGTKSVNGLKCRWIEIEEHVDEGDDGQPFTRWFKYLVPEEDLEPGGDPVGNLVEYWHRHAQAETATKSDARPAMLPMFLRGTPKKATAVEKPLAVFWQRGDFTVDRAEEQTQTIDLPEKLVIRDVVWKSPAIPFGTAAVNSTVRLDREGFPSYTYVRRLSLSDHGTGAKSKIPEAK